jgi:SAM-dependent MidA family methyltransferase
MAMRHLETKSKSHWHSLHVLLLHVHHATMPPPPLKLRRYIGQRLADYYAQPSNAVVGAASSTVNFANLWGEWHWKRVYRNLYQNDQKGQWLTPVEIFRPYYSQALAEYCLSQSSSEEFEIVELGGGRGTNASGILNHLQDQHPDAYERLSSYTIVDSSPTLHELQQELLLGDNSVTTNHSSKLNFLLKDLTDVAESNTELLKASSRPTIVLALELLDNLGHDKVRRGAVSRKLEHAVVETDNKQQQTESFQPLQDDALLKRILLTLPSYGGSMGHPVWVPSVACGVLMNIAQARPNITVLLADFDYLPPPDLLEQQEEQRLSQVAEGEPLVTDMDGIDHDCYLNSPHLADILFPTDFRKLNRFCTKIFKDDEASTAVKVTKQGQFLRSIGPNQVKATTSRWTGYSPMVDDFYNCSVLTVSRGSNSSKDGGTDDDPTTTRSKQ